MPKPKLLMQARAALEPDQVAAVYDRLAVFYDSFGRQPVREAYLRLLGDDLSVRRVLDAGCGAGQDSLALAARGALVTGVDLSGEMLARARRRLSHHPTVTLHQLNSENTGFDTGSFDTVLSAMEIFHHASLERALVEYSRLLVLGGKLLLATNHPFRNVLLRGDGNWLWEGVVVEDWGKHGLVPKQHWTLQSYVNTLASVGLRVVHADEVEAPDDVRRVQDTSISTDVRFPSFLVLEAIKDGGDRDQHSSRPVD